MISAEQRERILTKDPKSEEIIVPWAKGDDVRKWRVFYRNRYLILTLQGIDIEQYPAIEEHLASFKVKLSPKPDSTYKGLGRKPGDYKWYEIQDTTAYHSEFKSLKMVWPDIAKESRFAYDPDSLYFGNTAYICPTKDIALLGYLNSTLVWSYLMSHTSVILDGHARLIRQYIEAIPVPQVDKGQKVSKLTMKAIEFKKSINTSAGLAERRRFESQLAEVEREIDLAVYQLYGLTEKEIAIVEGKSTAD